MVTKDQSSSTRISSAYSLTTTQRVGLMLGPLWCIVCLLTPIALVSNDAWSTLGVAGWVLCWWITEPIPIGVTSLLPLFGLSITGTISLKEAATPYGHPIVFLFLSGFILAIALEEWKLHQRFALWILSKTGTTKKSILLGFMLATAILSMWISNTATTLMMLPMALSVLHLIASKRTHHQSSIRSDSDSDSDSGHLIPIDRFTIALLLGIAYAANIGGTMTLIGTPPNLALSGFFPELSFIDWLQIGVPFGTLMFIVTYGFLCLLFKKDHDQSLENATQVIRDAQGALGTISTAEKRVATIGLFVAVAWISRRQLNQLPIFAHLTDHTIGLLGVFALFITPSGTGRPLLIWDNLRRLPWDIYLLFGGGLCLANALQRVGIMHAVGDYLAQFSGQSLMGIILFTAISLLLTEVMSNIALVNVFIPVVSAVALAQNVVPLHLCIPVTLAASCAFMLPMGTPPNAIVFGSGSLKMIDMIRAGIFLNIAAVMLIVALCSLIL